MFFLPLKISLYGKGKFLATTLPMTILVFIDETSSHLATVGTTSMATLNSLLQRQKDNPYTEAYDWLPKCDAASRLHDY